MAWNVEGKTILITGATSGIGLEAAVQLARQGAAIVLVGRDPAKTERCAADVRSRGGSTAVNALRCDFAKQGEIRRLAEAYRAGHDRLDVLVNNAGTVFRSRTLTADGIEATFAVNHLAYFLLTNLLRDLLVKSAPARIVLGGHLKSGHLSTPQNRPFRPERRGRRMFTSLRFRFASPAGLSCASFGART